MSNLIEAFVLFSVISLLFNLNQECVGCDNMKCVCRIRQLCECGQC